MKWSAGRSQDDGTAVSGVRERLFDSFKLEDNFPENHLLRRIDRFLDLSDLRQYLPDFCNHTCRPLLESALMIRARFAGCCFAIRLDRRATSEKVAGRDGSAGDAGIEGEALATNQRFRQAPLVANRGSGLFRDVVATVMVEASGPRPEHRSATRAHPEPWLQAVVSERHSAPEQRWPSPAFFPY